MVNAYSTANLYTADEAAATANWKYKSGNDNVFSALTPTKSYETFCYHAAACATDDRFDGFCSFVDRAKYEGYFKKWKRERDPINERYYKANPDV